MKVQETKKRTVTTSGKLVSAKMGLDAAGVAMAISFLRDKIYSNKILAVLREYWANARDEHVKHNIGRAVDITLPHRDDPVLRIRDYALGMSQDDALKVFGQYFKSTKGDENESIGGFGIGSKAGHAYGDAFTVTSYFEGTCSVYEAVLETDEETGYTSGNMYLLAETPTDEQGVEISMTVKSHECRTFETTLVQMLRYLQPEDQPRVTKGGIEVQLTTVEQHDTMPSGDGWYVKKRGGSGYSYGGYKDDMIAVMGGIGYEIDTTIFSDDSAFTPEMRDMMGSSNLVVEFPIGSLAIAPSREGLEYIPRTKALIRTKLRQIQTDIETWVTKEISNAENVLRAKARLSELVRGLNSAWTKGKQFTYGGQTITPGLMFSGTFTEYDEFQDDKGFRGVRTEQIEIGFSDRLYYLIAETNSGGLQRARTLRDEDASRIVVAQFISEQDRDNWLEGNDLELSFFEDWETVEKAAVARTRTLSDGTTVRMKRSKISRSYLHHVYPNRWRYRDEFPRFHGEVPDHALYLMLDHKNECLAVDHKANEFKGVSLRSGLLDGAMRLIEKVARGIEGESFPAIFAVKISAKKLPDGWETIEQYLTRRLKEKAYREAMQDTVGTNAEYDELPTDAYSDIHARILRHADMLPDEYVEWAEDLRDTIVDTKARTVRVRYSTESAHIQFVSRFGLLDGELMAKAKKLGAEHQRVLDVYPIMRAVRDVSSPLVTEQVATFLSLAWENGAFTESSRNNTTEDA
jgi:hypothetical protein